MSNVLKTSWSTCTGCHTHCGDRSCSENRGGWGGTGKAGKLQVCQVEGEGRFR